MMAFRNKMAILAAGFVLGAAGAILFFHRSKQVDGIAHVMASGSEHGGGGAVEVASDDYARLLQRDLTAPIEQATTRDIVDTFNQARAGGKRHEATDILAPRNTPVHAIGDGTLRKLFLSKPGGLTIYEFDRDGIYCYYYAHLDHYADGIKEGMAVKRGDIIGFVGTTGDAPKDTPHLHFAITKLDAEKHWWLGEAIDPYPVLRKLAKH